MLRAVEIQVHGLTYLPDGVHTAYAGATDVVVHPTDHVSVLMLREDFDELVRDGSVTIGRIKQRGTE